MDLTVLIITKNSSATLEATLKSVSPWVDKILIIDDFSTDKTSEVAYRYGCTVIHNDEMGFAAQRAFALSQVTTTWTLVLDCDEVLTDDNKKEIEVAILDKKIDGYYLYFRNHLFGKKLLHGELHKKLVLFQTKKASIKQREIHEQFDVAGNTEELKSEVLHFSYRNIFQLYHKFFRYSILQAKQYKKENKSYGFRELFLYPCHMFYARFIKDEGYKDGITRLILDGAFAKMEFLSYFFIPFVKTKKRVAVDCGGYAVGNTVISGIERLIQGIYTHSSNDNQYYWFSYNKKAKNRLPSRFFSQLWLPIYVLINRCDEFLGVAGTIPFVLRFFKIKKILFLYDFGFFSSSEKYVSSAERLKLQTLDSIKSADKIIVLHPEIYTQFVNLFPAYGYKAVTMPSGADHLEHIKEIPLPIECKKPIALYVGVVKPVKQVEILLSAVPDEYSLVIAGPQEPEYVKKLNEKGMRKTQCIQNFSDSLLKWLYKKADVMVYASEHEGFCYPVLEALTLGLPVVALDLPVFQEYKKFFSHLTLVSDKKEMKSQLDKTNFKKQAPSSGHPYKWNVFVRSLETAIEAAPHRQPQRLREAGLCIVAFIVVLYKTPKEEKERLEREIEAIGLKDYFIYWIDNSNNKKGYAAGINEGIRKGLSEGCELFFALNPDISLRNMTKSNLLSVASRFDVWGYAMKQGGKIYYGGEIDAWRLSGGLVSEKPNVRFSTVDFVSGSVMGFSRETLQRIGFWDESYFMYYEDVDFCIRAKLKGLNVGIDVDTEYEHFEVSQYNERKAKWIAKSRWKFFWKYANIMQAVRELFRLPKTLLSK